VLEIRKIVFAAGATGSGDVDYSALKFNYLESPVVVSSFSSGWASIGSSAYQPLRYRREGKKLYIEGYFVASANHSTDSTLFILPVGYRPASLNQSLIVKEANITAGTITQLKVITTGSVAVVGSITNGQVFFVCGAIFLD